MDNSSASMYGAATDPHRGMQGHLAHSPGLPHPTPPGLQSPHYPYSNNSSSMPGGVMNTSSDSQIKRDKDSIYG